MIIESNYYKGGVRHAFFCLSLIFPNTNKIILQKRWTNFANHFRYHTSFLFPVSGSFSPTRFLSDVFFMFFFSANGNYRFYVSWRSNNLYLEKILVTQITRVLMMWIKDPFPLRCSDPNRMPTQLQCRVCIAYEGMLSSTRDFQGKHLIISRNFWKKNLLNSENFLEGGRGEILLEIDEILIIAYMASCAFDRCPLWKARLKEEKLFGREKDFPYFDRPENEWFFSTA